MITSGFRIGRLVAQWTCGRVGNKSKRIVWLCLCDCGKYTYVNANNLCSGNTESCGCLKTGNIIRAQKAAKEAITTHGMSKSREYRSYSHAKARCCNPNVHCYEDYGGRGIRFCFKDFEEFYRELGTRPFGTSLDRIDPNGNYGPGNVRWSTSQTQARNKRCDRCDRLLEEIKKLRAQLKGDKNGELI